MELVKYGDFHESSLKSRKNEARFLFKKCFANKFFFLVPYEIWRDLIVSNADTNSIALLSQTCWGFKEVVDEIGENNFNLALMFRREGQVDLAKKYLLKCVQNNNSTAMFHLAYAYYTFGWGLKGNEDKAFKWFERAANAGNVFAIAYFANLLNPFDVSELGQYWAKKALSSNHLFAIGFCHYTGLGTEKDYFKAFPFFELSAREGDEFGQEWLGHCFYYGQGCEKNYEKSLYWRLKSAKQGCCVAQELVADMYFNGIGCKNDAEQALFWCKRAAKQGSRTSQGQLEEFKALFNKL